MKIKVTLELDMPYAADRGSYGRWISQMIIDALTEPEVVSCGPDDAYDAGCYGWDNINLSWELLGDSDV